MFNFFKKKSYQNLDSLTLEDANKIIQAYGRYIEENTLMPDQVCDEKKLPYPKNVIRKSLIMAMYVENDPAIFGHLASGYILLANYHPNIGDKIKGGLNIDLNNKDMQEIARMITNQSDEREKYLTSC